MVSRLELGHLDDIPLASIRAVADALDIRIDIVPRWRGGELDRLLNSRHSALHESVARFFGGLSGWVAVPEVSFSIYGERGVIDVLAWHAPSRMLLVIELKTDIVDIQDLVGSVDRKRRLAAQIGRERGWEAVHVAAWLIVADTASNHRRVEVHRSVLRAAFPGDGRRMRGWLRDPGDPVAALSFWVDAHGVSTNGRLPTQQRVRRPQ
jgi:hypothetical protein